MPAWVAPAISVVSSALGINAASKAAKIERRANRMRNYREATQAVEQYTQIRGALLAGAASADQLGSSTTMGATGGARTDTLATLNYINRNSKMGTSADSAAQSAALYGQIAENATALATAGTAAASGVYGWIQDWGYSMDPNATFMGPPE